jgi:hypothetical protein
MKGRGVTEAWLLFDFAVRLGRDPFTYVDAMSPGQRAVAVAYMMAAVEIGR